MLWSDENHAYLLTVLQLRLCCYLLLIAGKYSTQFRIALIIHETKHHALQSLLDYLSFDLKNEKK
ncbi:hypothetical protein T12_8388 [Trichinella patagoniensis]|uniref:Uncharacterized protein n=1 Tax=Trichinella patagoniensis TaxID=990121 RepID=A0A0V0ZZP3_9BILA|nr:hypothetical protein T12_8388 [Trichinella patagoniensis]